MGDGVKTATLDHDCPARVGSSQYRKQLTEDDIRSTLFGSWCRGCERMIDGPYEGKKIPAAQFASPVKVAE